MSNMLRYTLLYTLFVIILKIITISTAQESMNHALLPTLEECGLLKLEEFEDRTGTVQANEFPWMAYIAYIDAETSKISFRCQAVLINQRYLLAVAHCVDNTGRLEANAVLFGDTTKTFNVVNGSRYVGIEEIVVHPYFNMRNSMNDIALLRLNETISYTNEIRPICLPGPSIKNKEFGAEQLIVTGVYRKGTTWDSHKLPVVVSNTLDCQRKWSGLMSITDKHLCGITCFQKSQYLSGSALMDTFGKTNYYLAGLLSAGRALCTYPEEPDIFTRIDRYMDWIKDNMDA